MLPAEIVYLDTLPVTATGKVDRNALSQISPMRDASGRLVKPPQDDVERTVARVFEQLLKLAPVGCDDDFFLLGGDSLLGVELQTRLSETFGAHIGHFHEKRPSPESPRLSDVPSPNPREGPGAFRCSFPYGVTAASRRCSSSTDAMVKHS